MRKTLFAGLTVLGPEDSIFADGAAFTTRDRDEIDRGIKIGAKTHRHTGLPGLSDPTKAASASVIASGGTIDSGTTITVGYTLEDGEGGETRISPLSIVSTPTPLDVPLNAPEAEADYTGGSLLTDNYTYGITYLDGDGGETPLGPVVLVNRDPGFPNAQIKLKGLTTGLEAAGATGYRLYRARGGGEFAFLKEGTPSEDTFTDDGSVSPVCDDHPPTDNLNNTNKVSTLQVKLPTGLASGATFINLYATITGSFAESSLLAQYPLASAGASPTFAALEFLDSQPPDVNRSYGGAHMIDPDTELLDWHWKRPVAASGALGSGGLGDVRLVENTGELFAVLLPLASAAGPSQWTKIGSAGIKVQSDLGPAVVSNTIQQSFIGSGNVKINVTDEGGGKARVTITGLGGTSSALDVFGSGSAVPGAETADAEKIELLGSGGVNIKESTNGKAAKVIVEGQAATLGQEGMGVLIHGGNASATRPKAFRQYTWIGSVKPNNLAENDIWVEA